MNRRCSKKFHLRAQIVSAFFAELASPATDSRLQCHSIPWHQRLHLGTNFINDPSTFMADHHRLFNNKICTSQFLKIPITRLEVKRWREQRGDPFILNTPFVWLLRKQRKIKYTCSYQLYIPPLSVLPDMKNSFLCPFQNINTLKIDNILFLCLFLHCLSNQT